MSEKIRHFRELKVYRLAKEIALEVFELSKRFPVEEKYSLTDQIRRSSRSVCANVAEAWRKRRYPAAFVAKLNDCEAECSETQVWLEFAKEFGYLTGDKFTELDGKCDHLTAMLVNMSAVPGQWTYKEMTARLPEGAKVRRLPDVEGRAENSMCNVSEPVAEYPIEIDEE